MGNQAAWTAHILVNTSVCVCSTELGQKIPQKRKDLKILEVTGKRKVMENMKRSWKSHGIWSAQKCINYV